MQGKWIKIAAVVIAVPVVTISAFHMVRAYEEGTTFHPMGSNRDLQVNQVVFSGDEDTTARKNNEEQDKNGESELWEKDKTAEDSLNPNLKNSADYLFQTGRMNLPGNAETVNLTGEETTGEEVREKTWNNALLPGDGEKDTGNNNYVYDVTEDTDKADLIIAGNGQNGGENGGSTAGNGTDNGNGNSAGAGETAPTGTPAPAEPVQTPQPKPLPKPTPQPTARPADTAIDPEGEKSNEGGLTKPGRYEEGVLGDAEEEAWVTIAQSAYGVQLYKGQKIEDPRTVYNALNTQVRTKNGNFYSWGTEHFNRYVRIAGLSFDNGKTWKDFRTEIIIPTELPENEMLIRTEYRFSAGTDQWTEKIIPYTPKDSRILVLSEKLTKPNQVISKEQIVNAEYSDQYKAGNGNLNLLRLQMDLLGKDRLQALFPGWTENGKAVPWFYEVTVGRHILEPEDMVPLDEKYTVKLEQMWLTDDYRHEGNMGDHLSYLQTLTNVSEQKSRMGLGRILRLMQRRKNDTTLEVPEYVQAVDIEENAGLSVDYLAIPETVMVIDDSEGLKVNKGYRVDEDNPYYCSSEDGLLLDAKETVIYAVPCEKETLTVPADIREVHLTAQNHIKTIHLEHTDAQTLPELDLKMLKNCNIVVQDDLLESYLVEHKTQITKENGLSISAASDEAQEYTVVDDIIRNKQKELCGILSGEKNSLTIPAGTEGIRSGVFGGTGIKTLYVPEDGSMIRLDQGCFADSSVEKILCYSEEQYQSIVDQLEQAGGSGIRVELLLNSKEGYYYQKTTLDDSEFNILVRVPGTITEYDGTVTDPDGNPVAIQQIGDGAFENCTELVWVSLPEETDTIGDRAFKNCHALQGIMINTTDSITIGECSMDGCEGLRFLGSNAKNGILKNDYYPEMATDLLAYAPTDAEGYNSHFTSFTAESGVYGYRMVVTEEGDRLLYGLDEEESPWLLLRSGQKVSKQLKLPETTVEIFRYAMAGVKSTADEFTVNWTELSALLAVDAGAFQGSALGGKVEFSQWWYQIGEYAFAQCPGITEVVLDGIPNNLERNMFYECSGLKKATLGTLGYASLYGGVFSKCDQLRDIYFTSTEPPQLMVEGMFYRFNYEWTQQLGAADEAEYLHLHVPEGYEQKYINEWRYLYAGYYNVTGEPIYLQMWEKVREKNTIYDATVEAWVTPTDEEVDALLETELLTSENRLRHMMGLKDTSEPGNFYNYRQKNGILTLFRVPHEKEVIGLEGYDMDLPDGWYLDYIATGAFSGCTQLEGVYIPSNLAGIYSDAFAGAQLAEGMLTLYLDGNQPPELIRPDDDTPFSFGVEDDQIALAVSPFCWNEKPDEDTYVKAWAPALAENTSAEALEAAKVRLHKMFAAGRGEDTTGTQALTSVSDGNAVTVSSGNAETDSTQEETVQ